VEFRKKNSRFARQKKYILTLMLSEKKILNETKNHNPPPFKLNGQCLSCIFRVLAHWDKCPRIDMLINSDTLVRFQDNQYLLFRLNAVCLDEKQQINNATVCGLTGPAIEPTIYRTRSDHSNHYTNNAVLCDWSRSCVFNTSYTITQSMRLKVLFYYWV
jgi:hypothetical protein